MSDKQNELERLADAIEFYSTAVTAMRESGDVYSRVYFVYSDRLLDLDYRYWELSEELKAKPPSGERTEVTNGLDAN